MARFDWFGRDAAQQPRTGVLEAASAALAAQALADGGIVPVAIRPHVEQADARDTLRHWLGRDRVGDDELLLFTRQMHTLLRAGVPILRALQGLQESSVHDGLRDVLGRLRQSLDAGHELSYAMAREGGTFDGFFVAMVRVGEGTGQLTEIFDALHHHLDFQRALREQVDSALRYPKFVLIAMVVAVAVINIFVIPAFAKVFANLGSELPLMTRVLLGTSQFFLDTWSLMLAGLVLLVLAARSFVGTARGRLAWDRWKLRLPVAGKVLRKSALSRACRGLALALRSGVPVLDSLRLAAAVTDNAYLEQALVSMRSGVERGDSLLATSRKAGIFTPIVLQMVMVGEESGTLEEMLEEIGGMYRREVEYELKTMSQQIEPILIGALGCMVLVLALGVFMPMWDLGKASLK